MLNTQQGAGLKILDIYKLDREGEAERFSQHNHIEHRKLLWHGSNVAVFAAILSTGLKMYVLATFIIKMERWCTHYSI